MAKEKTIKGLQRLAPFKPKSGPTSDARQTAQRLPMVSTYVLLYPPWHVQNVFSVLFTAHTGIEYILVTKFLCSDRNIH